MTAGGGIVHEEAAISTHEPLEGLQLWVGLSQAVRYSDSGFVHGGLEQPVFEWLKAQVRVVPAAMAGRSQWRAPRRCRWSIFSCARAQSSSRQRLSVASWVCT